MLTGQRGDGTTAFFSGLVRERTAFAIAFMVAVGIAYLRNPIAFHDPTMFTEDGTWMAALYTRGVVDTYLNARSDYLVTGNVLMLHLAMMIAEVTGVGIIGTPRIIAVLSYIFYGFVAALPIVALRHQMSLPARLLVMLLVAMVPVGVPQSSAEIWGRASNIGYAFAFVAALAVVWRESSRRNAEESTIIPDVLIILSCATNPIAFPIVAIFYGVTLLIKGRAWRFRREDLYLAVVFTGLAAVTAWRLVSHERPLEEAVAERTWSGFILSGIARPILYPIVFPIYDRLTDQWAIAATLLITVFVLVAFALCPKKSLLGFFLASTGVVIVAIAIQRPLLPLQMGGYTGTYPDRYFYAQNVMVLCSVVWAADTIRHRFGQTWGSIVPFALALLFLLNVPRIFIPGQVACAEVGTGFAQQLEAGVGTKSRPNVISVEICPPGWYIEFPASEIRDDPR